MRKNKKLIMALAVVLAIATVTAGATFAWYTNSDSAKNHMETSQFGNGDVKLAEIFDEEDPFDPGVDINKDVWVTNTGGTGALARISFAEILTMLKNNGNSVRATAIWDGTAAGTVPQIVSKNAFATGGAYDGWIDYSVTPIPTANATVTVTIPSGVKLFYKNFPTTIGSVTKNNYEFVAYAVIGTAAPYTGEYQLVAFDVATNPTAKTIAISNWGYLQFEKNAPVYAKWANFNTAVFPDMIAPFPAAAATPTLTIPAAPAEPRVNVVTDPSTPKYINLLFTEYVTTDLAIAKNATDGMWWYNSADGYFYYIDKLGSGQATNPLLDAVGLHSDAGNAYMLMEFDLIVNMEAIQNVQEALSATSGGGWGLSGTVLTSLIDALDSRNAFVLP